MNKQYTSALAVVLIAGTTMAQSGSNNGRPALKERYSETKDHAQAGAAKGAVIWSDDFSTPSNWTIDHYGPFDLDWQIGVGLVNTGGYTTPPIESTTAANGYAMLDSDGANNSGTDYESSNLTTANPIDLSLYPNVVLQFENQYRKYTDEQCYVEISTNNTDWLTTLDPTTDISAYPNIFYVWIPDPEELIQGVSPGNPTVKRINISAVAGGQSQVWIRFHWTGIWGYSWFVDDVSVEEQAQFDIAMVNGFVSHTGDGNEFCRIPTGQLNPDMNIGGEYTNFGVQDQTNVVVTGDAVAFSASTNTPIVVSDETFLMDETVTTGALANGTYTATFSVSSDQIGSDGFPGNNSYLRNFEVTDYTYSLDGIGNHPPGYESLTSTGTNTFTDNSDGLFLFTYYPIGADLTVYGLEVLLANGTVEGGLAIASVHDTTEILTDNVSSPLGQSADYFITQNDVDDGRAIILLSPPLTLSTGGYYAGLELYSNTNANDIRVLDDITVPQPVLSSMIHLTSDGTSYTNGNSYAIRLISDPSIGINEQDELAGINVSPNPSTDLITITASTPQTYYVEVMNTIGEVILNDGFNMSTTMDLGGLAKGVYTVRISTDKASTVKPVMIY